MPTTDHRASRWTLLLTVVSLVAACTAGEPGDDPATASGSVSDDSARAAGSGAAAATRCAPDNGGITLPSGFCASIFADDVGGARHIDVAPNGDVYVQLVSAKKGAESGSGRSGGILALRDTNGDGVADTTAYFGALGGTGVRVHEGWLYADDSERIVRYRLTDGALVPTARPETLVTGLPGGGHEARNIALGRNGELFVNVGSLTNSCQLKERGNRSPGHDPCTELETRAGIWRFDASRTGQTQATGRRYATGIRNAIGLALHPRTAELWAAQHGRDQLMQNWGFTAQQSAENPAEELMQVDEGDDFGWPYCYWSVDAGKRVTAPEYGGDGMKTERCADRKDPVATFPGHWAPMDLLFYTGSQFPARYRDGAFIAFHGSWNRAPQPQAGYNVVFQPLDGEAARGRYEVFADGFAGANVGPATATHRPVGLAEAPDGSLFVTDDKGGRIWKIVYRGN
jgi:glucose/arabinose dehydrogenase